MRERIFREIVLFTQEMSERVLSIQSHVVSGYVGNKCAVFPLQVKLLTILTDMVCKYVILLNCLGSRV